MQIEDKLTAGSRAHYDAYKCHVCSASFLVLPFLPHRLQGFCSEPCVQVWELRNYFVDCDAKRRERGFAGYRAYQKARSARVMTAEQYRYLAQQSRTFGRSSLSAMSSEAVEKLFGA